MLCVLSHTQRCIEVSDIGIFENSGSMIQYVITLRIGLVTWWADSVQLQL